MARPPRRAVNRKTPMAPVRLDQGGTASSGGEAVEKKAESPAVDPAVEEQVVAEIEALLRGQPNMTDEGLEHIMRDCREAIAQASLEPSLSLPERSEWIATIDALIQSGALEQDSGDALVRQFDTALGPMHDPKVQRAMELAKRIERDGEAKAREWLASQEKADQAEQADRQQAAESTRNMPPQRGAITNSRSRRLRGPPAR